MMHDSRQCGTEESGRLDGTTIVRFTHISDSAAGTEMHLECLNRILLQRNKLTIFQFYMPEVYTEIQTRSIGKGTLITIPLRFTEPRNYKKELFHYKILRHFRYLLAGHDCYNPNFRHAVGFEKILSTIFTDHTIDIAINHFPGSIDSMIFMKEACKRGIPVAVINHFNNSWFNKPPIRKQLYYARIAAGLSNVHVPGFLKSHFVNISNGIDTDFYDPDPIPQKNIRKNILLLPARIVPNKGHKDLLAVTEHLKNKGIECLSVFAGKIYDNEYKSNLDRHIVRQNLSENILFTGHLSQEELRQWYRDSALLVFPTSHDEGLPRVVIEAQSMRVPPVCYNTGGTSEAIEEQITGFTVNKRDINNLQKHIIELLSNKEKRESMGVHGRAFVIRKFSLTALARRHERLYRELISGFRSFA